MNFKRLEDANVDGSRVLVRVDFNVPRTDDGGIVDDTRLRAAIPTIQALQEAGAKVILLSHFGRPKGKPDPELSLSFIVPALSKALGSDVYFSTDLTKAAIDAMPSEGVMVLENTRFHLGEEAGDDGLAKDYAALGDVFVADAFSVAHRDHVTSSGIAKYLPAYAGLAMEREIDHISQALEHPRQPVMGVVGGAKVSTKIDLLKNLVTKLDILVIGGGMANTFLHAQGYNVGRSLCEKNLKDTALTILDNAKKANCKIILPIDVVAATEFRTNAPHRVCGLEDVKPTEMILDAGPDTVELILDAMDEANTLIWNGPLGAFEIPPFDTSSVECAKYAAKLTREDKLISVAGGGDTVAALNHANAADDFTFISTAGGAFLEWMEGKSLPGIEILRKNSNTHWNKKSGDPIVNLEQLNAIAVKMVTPGQGLLAADESTGTIGKRFDSIKTESTFEKRRDWREMLFRTDAAMRDHVSGVILYDETIRQDAADGTSLVDLIKSNDSLPGIKVDMGTTPLAGRPGELITQGLDGLRERLAEYYELGARFAKWRAVYEISPPLQYVGVTPTRGAMKANNHALARYAALCQEANIVPIVEPEVLMGGAHNVERCHEVTEKALNSLFTELYEQGVKLEGIILKPNMVVAGKKCKDQPSVEEVAERTIKVLKDTVPAAVPGIAFLSGGQDNEIATEHLDMINKIGNFPWNITYSYGRALQQSALFAWKGKKENYDAAQKAFYHRAHMNGLASMGEWDKSLET